MEKFTPYGKLSKRKRREKDLQKRKGWEGISPVTRKPENSKAYKRKKHPRGWDGENGVGVLFLDGVVCFVTGR